MIDAHVPFRRAVPGLGVGPRVLNPGGDCGRIASSAGSMLSGCTSHIFRRARRIPGRDTLQRRSFGAAHKLLGRPVSQARPQIFRVGFLKRGMHFLCALHCVLGYSSQLFHTQLEVTFPDWHTSALAHDHSQAGGSTRLLWSHATLWPSPLTPCPLGIVQGTILPVTDRMETRFASLPRRRSGDVPTAPAGRGVLRR